MESLQSRVESWLRGWEKRAKLLKVSGGPLQWRMRWPWILNDGYREQRKRIQEEYERRRKQLHDLCAAVKANSISYLQDIFCCMVLSECVYKIPASDLVHAVNRFKADFGGQIVALERDQPFSDHVPHSDVMTDANILQGAIFHKDPVEDTDGTNPPGSRKGNGGYCMLLLPPNMI